MSDECDLETWLLDVGDAVIAKKSEHGIDALSDVERAIYNLWVLDYAVRNSGSLSPVSELQPTAVADLRAFASVNGLRTLTQWLSGVSNEAAFCDSYLQGFGGACIELKNLCERTHQFDPGRRL